MVYVDELSTELLLTDKSRFSSERSDTDTDTDTPDSELEANDNQEHILRHQFNTSGTATLRELYTSYFYH